MAYNAPQDYIVQQYRQAQQLRQQINKEHGAPLIPRNAYQVAKEKAAAGVEGFSSEGLYYEPSPEPPVEVIASAKSGVEGYSTRAGYVIPSTPAASKSPTSMPQQSADIKAALAGERLYSAPPPGKTATLQPTQPYYRPDTRAVYGPEKRFVQTEEKMTLGESLKVSVQRAPSTFTSPLTTQITKTLGPEAPESWGKRPGYISPEVSQGLVTSFAIGAATALPSMAWQGLIYATPAGQLLFSPTEKEKVESIKFMTTPRGAAEFAGATAITFGAAKTGPVVAREFPVRYANVEVPFKTGGASVYRGLYVKAGTRTSGLVGKTPEGFKLGQPTYAAKYELSQLGDYTPYTSFESNIAQRSIKLAPEEATRITLATKIMKATQNTQSIYIKSEFPKETRTLSPGAVKEVTGFAKSEGGQVYGSFAAEAQMPKELSRSSGDIDLAMRKDIAPKIAETKVATLAANLKRHGDIIRVSPETPTLIESFGNKEWHHAVDIHYKGMGAAGSDIIKEGAFGFKFEKPSVLIEQTEAMALSEQGLRKGASATSFSERGVWPQAHRVKDITDFYSVQKTLAKSMYERKGARVESLLEEWKKTYKDQSMFDTKAAPEISFKIPARSKQYSLKTSPSAYRYKTPSVSPSIYKYKPAASPSPYKASGYKSPSISPYKYVSSPYKASPSAYKPSAYRPSASPYKMSPYKASVSPYKASGYKSPSSKYGYGYGYKMPISKPPSLKRFNWPTGKTKTAIYGFKVRPQPKKYSTSLYSQIFNVKGKRPKGLLTGVEIRPL
jgi:hypothetical protein